MRITIIAVGRMRAGPARDWFDDYARRLTWPVALREVEERRPMPPARRLAREAALIAAALPARGTVNDLFGVVDEFGVVGQGVRIATRPGAQVVAPFEGMVAFAGPFEDFDLVLIIDHGTGYHTVLAGLGRIDTAVGRRLLAGEPVGVMSAAGGDAPELYVELRRDGEAIDPLPWLAIDRRESSG